MLKLSDLAKQSLSKDQHAENIKKTVTATRDAKEGRATQCLSLFFIEENGALENRKRVK